MPGGKSHNPKILPKWKKALGLTKNQHHTLVPITPDIWPLLENIDKSNYERHVMFVQSGIMDAGMYESYLNLLCKHRLIRRLKGTEPHVFESKTTKKWFVVITAKHVLTKKGMKVLRNHA